ncbi:MAG: hypothetical protein KI790_13270 [Cyclobacteriaceae bacterium]|nr:hypothetical protein [Cyclobacteriaceae bacterium HetDA_MAG_MS6]
MNKQIKWTLIAIGSLTILATIYAYFTDKEEFNPLIGAVIGLSLIVLPLFDKNHNHES